MTTLSVEAVENCVNEFNGAVVKRDAEALKVLTSEALSYGHSKGKIESQSAFIDNILSDGATQFTAIEISNQSITLDGDNAIVRHTVSAETSKNGVAGKLNIQNMMVWTYTEAGWQLLARQAFSA